MNEVAPSTYFTRMQRINPGIVFPAGDQESRIFHTLFDVVIRRIGLQVFELFRIITAAIFFGPDVGQFLSSGVTLFDEVFSRRNKIIKDILLLAQHSRFVPLASVLAATAQIRHHINATGFQPGQGAG